MVDPATSAGLVLAVIPLMISALENYEYTFKPIIIFGKRYEKEVRNFQDKLKVQRVNLANECSELLQHVSDVDINDDRRHRSWQDPALEEKIKTRLEENYGACVSALRLINGSLTDILSETGTLKILTENRQHGTVGKTWLKRLRARLKISFSTDRFDGKLRTLQSSIDNLSKIRKHVDRVKVTSKTYPTDSITSQIMLFRYTQHASSRLYDTLSSVWRCGTPQEHFANICLEDEDACASQPPTVARFDLAWTCPSQGPLRSGVSKPLRLSVEAHSEDLCLAGNNAHQTSKVQQELKISLDAALRPKSTISMTSTSSAAGSLSSSLTSTTLQDLYTIPNLCHHLGQRSTSNDPICCVGFLQKSKTFKHLIYTPNDGMITNPEVKTLEAGLTDIKAQSKMIPLPEKVRLSRCLAHALLRYHSTPWLAQHWKSRDVVFFGITDLSQDPLRTPYLKAKISMTPTSPNHTITAATSLPAQRTPIRNQTLFNLGVMLVELAYDSPLEDLVIPTDVDPHGDEYTLYYAALRLGEDLKRRLAPGYGAAVTICLHGGFGASCDLEDTQVQERFYHEVIQKLTKFADALSPK